MGTFRLHQRVAADRRVGHRCVRYGALASAVLALAACGSGGGSAGGDDPEGQPSGPTNTEKLGSVTIEAATSSGTPVSGVTISLNGGFDGRSASTDASGSVQFADIPPGEATALSFAAGFHAAQERFAVSSDQNSEVTLILEQVTEATPVVLASLAVAAGDGRSLTIDVDIAVLGQDGQAIPTFTVADFTMLDSDCAFVPCGYDAELGQLPMGGYRARAVDAAFGWHSSSSPPLPPLAVALMLEQSAAMGVYDPQGLRLPAIGDFLDSIVPPDVAVLATFRGSGATSLTTHGEFTSDGALFLPVLDELAGPESGGNPLHCAVSEMLAFIAEHAPDGAAPSLVVVTNSSPAGADACSQQSVVSMNPGQPRVPIVAIGGNETGAALAAQSGGSFAVVTDPAQYPAAVQQLDAIVKRRLDYNSLRFVLTPEGAPATGHVFRPLQQTIWAYVRLRISPQTAVIAPLVMTVQ